MPHLSDCLFRGPSYLAGAVLYLGLATAQASTTYTFTNADATGRLGPTQAQVNAAYSGTNLAGKVTVPSNAGIQHWTVPFTGVYQIEVFGAEGGRFSTLGRGGRGARMRGDFTLNQGDVLHILVGQRGGCVSSSGCGGGGGSFVVRSGTALIVAGGGGGQGGCSDSTTAQSFGRPAVVETSGTGGEGVGGAGGISGGGGGAVEAPYPGGGGGGFSGNGEYGVRSSGSGCATGAAGFSGLDGDAGRTAGGRSFLNGGVGGRACYQLPAVGGFGGGGGEGGCGGAGGGGYSGGGGGQTDQRGGGGGGSLNTGSAPSNSSGVHTGHGLVTITLLNAPPTVTTSPATSITTTSAVLSGNVTADGGVTVTQRGVVWSTSPDPVVGSASSATTDGTTGSFSVTATGLEPGVTYHARAFATNSLGTSYGSTVTFTALQLTQTITFGELGDRIYSPAPFTVSATATSDLDVAFDTLDPSVCTVSGTSVTMLRSGACTISASQPGNVTYAAAPHVDRSFTISKASQTITFTAPASRTYAPESFSVADSASTSASDASLSVAFSSESEAVCTMSGTDVTVVAAGTCTLTATQSGNDRYFAADPVTQSFEIAQRVLSLSGARVYDGTRNTPADSLTTVANLVGGQTLLLSGTATTASPDVGVRPIDVTGITLADGTNGGVAANYTLGGGVHAVTIEPRPVRGAFDVAQRVYDGSTAVSDELIINRRLETVPGEAASGLVSVEDVLDEVTLLGGTATLASADADEATPTSVTLTDATLSGDRALNYVLTNPEINSTMTVGRRPLNDDAISIDPIADQTVTTESLTPLPVLRFQSELGEVELVKDTDYSIVEYEDNISVGAARIILAGLGNFSEQTQQSFKIVADEPDALRLIGDTSDLNSGSNRMLEVEIVDQFGNVVVADSGRAVTLAKSAGAGSVDGLSAVDTSEGIGTWAIVGGQAGSVTLTASAEGLDDDSLSFEVVSAAASQMSITTQPAKSAVGGEPFSRQPVIQLRDAFGNVVSEAGVVVAATIATGVEALSGTLTATTDSNGVATFTDLTLTGEVGVRTLRFTAPGLTEVVSNEVFAGIGIDVEGGDPGTFVLDPDALPRVMSAPLLAGLSLPHGAMAFDLEGGAPGSTATVTLTYPEPLPEGIRYWKLNPSNDEWFAMPEDLAVISGNTITLTLVDGGVGDFTGEVNGRILDPGGPGVLVSGFDQPAGESLLSDVVDELGAGGLDSEGLAAINEAISTLLDIAQGGDAELTVAHLESLGFDDITEDDLPAITQAVASTPADGSGLASLVQLEQLITAATADDEAVAGALAALLDPATTPSVADYAGAGLYGLTEDNLLVINEWLDGLSSEDPTRTELQATINAINLLLNEAGEGPDAPATLTLEAYQALGLSQIDSDEAVALLNSFVGTQSAADVTDPDTLQALATMASQVTTGQPLTTTQLAQLGITVPSDTGLTLFNDALAEGARPDDWIALNQLVLTAERIQQQALLSDLTPQDLVALGIPGVNAFNIEAVRKQLERLLDIGLTLDSIERLNAWLLRAIEGPVPVPGLGWLGMLMLMLLMAKAAQAGIGRCAGGSRW